MSEGYEVPVHRSLTEMILLGGVPRSPAILLWTISAALGFGLQQIWVLPVGIGLHFALMGITRKDPYFFEVFIRALKTPKRFYP
jgi:type IV secretion system protein VirB3